MCIREEEMVNWRPVLLSFAAKFVVFSKIRNSLYCILSSVLDSDPPPTTAHSNCKINPNGVISGTQRVLSPCRAPI